MTNQFKTWLLENYDGTGDVLALSETELVGFMMKYIDQHQFWDTTNYLYRAEVWHLYRECVRTQNIFKYLNRLIANIDGKSSEIKEKVDEKNYRRT